MAWKEVIWIGIVGIAGVASIGLAPAMMQNGDDPAAGQGQIPKTPPGMEKEPAGLSTADHSTFEELQQDFKTGPEVTAACLGCHTEAAGQIMATSHWTWLSRHQTSADADGKPVRFGKGSRVINNFCIAVQSNEPRCTSCHIGYGWKDSTFDFENETLVDCLVCHDQTGKYKKFPTAAGHPVYESTPQAKREWPKGKGKFWEPAPLAEIAQSVGAPSRRNCGACHFFGGGGEGVKHGDMDVSLANPPMHVDVHMSPDGANMHCVDCHTTHSHDISGRYYEQAAYNDREFVIRGSPEETNLLACESCHTVEPHRNAVLEGRDVANAERLDNHIDRVSCQACHIPTMAREKATKMWWDWSVAGKKTEEGKPVVKKVETRQGNTPDPKVEKTLEYHTKKGEFIWVMDEKPEYRWFNGNTVQTFIDTKIDDQTPGRELGKVSGEWDKIDLDQAVIDINVLQGDANDPTARIWPIKVHRGIQPYDKVNKILAVPKLFPSGKDKGEAYWKSYSWERAIAAGMAENGAPWSGELGWVQSEMNWPLAHMVAPAKESVGCVECHSTDGRMAGIEGVYIPGRDRNVVVETAGLGIIGLTFIGVVFHGLIRLVTNGGKK